MALEILPIRTGGAAENMALDFLLLQRWPKAPVPRFRHYRWRGPAFTFGYAQKIAAVRTWLPADVTLDLCRRPTGGGLVDHREDWTYSMVIPRGHPLEDVRATQSYREVHEALASALRAQGVDCVLTTSPAEPDALPVASAAAGLPAVGSAKAGVCFQRAEVYDVVHRRSGEKIAGAAQKRNKHGLLFQGSIWRPATVPPAIDRAEAGPAVNWDQFHDDFSAALAAILGTTAEPVPWPELNDEEVSALTEQYSLAEWLEYR